MKSIKLAASALAVLAVVGSALGFKAKAFSAEADVYCSFYTPIPNEPCAIQTGVMLINAESVASGGTNGNPCAGLHVNPFVSTSNNQCVGLLGQYIVLDAE